ncbi:Aste57867_24039 [Aphanomyces stellatus]|uniref:Aste57867_24039 protein n=1 Tax=Aphanomyces stellatus TaxID=120398 RepID=A0A485LPF2_9STRA|nr:hypothetical protein As57867_023966 [Aphanomyces stellatus]VFU00682.1 Aste57867_24039 [Aphanomyces stellatus]
MSKTNDVVALKGGLKVPILGGFFIPPANVGVIAPPSRLRVLTTLTYAATLAAFVYLLVSGFSATQSVTVTVISPTANLAGFTCKSLGTYSGTPYQCRWGLSFDTVATQALCHPATPPINCPLSTPLCGSGADVSNMGGMWTVGMTNIHFDSYDACLGRIDSVLDATIAGLHTSETPTNECVLHNTYSGNVDLGSDSPNFAVYTQPLATNGNIFTTAVFSLNGAVNTCVVDSSNFDTKLSVVPGSSMDMFYNSFLPTHLRQLSDGSAQCPLLTPATLCAPFRGLGPYSCTQTTLIHERVLTVIGSSIGNAQVVLGVLTMGLAFILKQVHRQVDGYPLDP